MNVWSFDKFFSPLSDISQAQSAVVGPFSVIGSGTKIGKNTKILNSVVGIGCKIGSNVHIEGCYIWDNVTIEDGCELRHAIVCEGVIMKSGSALEPGVVLSFKVWYNFSTHTFHPSCFSYVWTALKFFTLHHNIQVVTKSKYQYPLNYML